MAEGISVRAIIGEVARLYRQNARVLLALAALVFIFQSVLGAFFGGSGLALNLLLAVLAGAFTFLYTAMVTRLISALRGEGAAPPSGDLLDAASERARALIIGGVLWMAAILVGLSFFIVPGLYLLTVWAVVAPVLTLERASLTEAFARSQRLVRGNGWPVFTTILLLFVALSAAAIGAAALGASLAGGIGRFVAFLVANVLLSPPQALMAAVLYFELGRLTHGELR